MTSSLSVPTDLDPIVKTPNGGRIYQGNAVAALTGSQSFDVIVFCAEELQPVRESLPPNKTIVYAPIDDAILSKRELEIVHRAARKVAEAYGQGKRVLVSCVAGRNRSGLVTALAIRYFYGVDGRSAIATVKERRKGAKALTNDSFTSYLANLEPYKRPDARLVTAVPR